MLEVYPLFADYCGGTWFLVVHKPPVVACDGASSQRRLTGDFWQQIWQLKSGLLGQSKQPPLQKIGHYLTLHRMMLYMVLQIRVHHFLFRVVQSDKIEVFTIIETPEMKPVLHLLRLVESVATPEKVRPKTWQFSCWGWCIVPNRGFPEKGGTPIAGWFINGKSHLEMDDLGVYPGLCYLTAGRLTWTQG